ncbi:hypothetical protein CALVIDRAFT_388012 [Calocera viscosa TUFC12733]|uniref:Skg3/CAF120-like PH-like domain-containing protein n=1 Tax=Calocera viscosa (strain TUFC12733) TaxID=1330018 RepID=A0A167GLW9_CALVF|nr:hypothetical protein CALVIDRAFT_388012 [Calocera viscosa TUFC12733]
MSGWSTRNDGFVGPAQLQRLPPPPTRDFRRPPALPPYHHYHPQQQPQQPQQPPQQQQQQHPELAHPKPQAKARNSFFAAFRSIGNVNMPLEPRPRRVSESTQQQQAQVQVQAAGREISAPQRLQPKHQYSLPPSVSAPVLGVHTPPLQQLPSNPNPNPTHTPRSTMERTTSSSRQASGALSDHGHGSAGSAAPGAGLGQGGGTITAGSFAAMREDRRRASMVDLPLQSGEGAGGGGAHLPTVQESPRQPQQAASRLSQSLSSPPLQQQQQASRLSQSQSYPQQQQQAPAPSSSSRLSQSHSHSQPADRTSTELSTSSSSSAHFSGTPPTGGPLSSLHPELRSGISLSIAHAHKVYFSGPLARRLELEPSGRPPHRQEGWVDVWAQLGGTTLSVWEMRAIEEASQKGEEVPPSYINVTDAFIGVLGSIEIPASGTQPASKRTNILTLNTAGSNLLLFSAPSGQALVSWAAALRLATWEKSRLEEIYTGHLLRMSLTASNGGAPFPATCLLPQANGEMAEFKQPKTALTRGKLEGWVRIRLAGQVDWKRVYAIITSAYDPLQSPNIPGSAKSSTAPASAFAHAVNAQAPHLSSAAGRAESPTRSPSVLTKRRMSGIFRSSGGGSQNGGHGSAGIFGTHVNAKGLVDGVAPPVIAFHATPPQGRKPKPPLLTLTHVTQAFSLYPERPEMISKSNLFKIEALLGTEVDHSTPSPEKGSSKTKGKVEERFAGKMAGREGWCIVQPEVGEEPNGQKASLVMDMLKWLVGEWIWLRHLGRMTLMRSSDT